MFNTKLNPFQFIAETLDMLRLEAISTKETSECVILNLFLLLKLLIINLSNIVISYNYLINRLVIQSNFG